MSKIAERWRTWTRSQSDVEAAELQEEMHDVGVVPIRTCEHGALVSVTGTVRVITFRPKSTTPALEIELYDGSGCVNVIWLGRRRIPGIETGRRMVVTGRLTCSPRVKVIYNPRYQLLPTAG
ncbi:MAG: DNA-binding protein [Candidatus Nanopelagicales bacterium]|nr:DNA-binding protein [Candidatus Nanopelagicales bacterium]